MGRAGERRDAGMGYAVAVVVMLGLGMSPPMLRSAPAQQPAEALDAARAAFEALPEDERKAIQDALVWTGDYNGTLDGSFGKRSFDAIRAFETRSRLAVDGILTPDERTRLIAAAGRQRDAAGFAVIDDKRTGMRIGVPLKVLDQRGDTPGGSLFRARRGGGSLATDLIPVAAGTSLEALFDDLGAATPTRRITYKVLRDTWFVVTGEEGGQRFFTRYAATDAGLRGFTIAYPASAAATFDRLTIAIANSFEPEPGAAPAQPAGTAAASTPTTSGRMAFTAIVLDAGRALTSDAVRACAVPSIAGKPVKPAAGGGPVAILDGASAAGATPPGWRGPDSPEHDVFVVGYATFGGDHRLVATPGILKVANDGTAHLSAALQPGMSGAPVIDRSGALVAIVGALPETLALVSGVALSPAVPATTAASFAQAAGLPASGTDVPRALTLGAVAEAWRQRIVAVACASR